MLLLTNMKAVLQIGGKLMANTKKKDTYCVASDTGYGYLKAFINDEFVYVPTTWTELTDPSTYPNRISWDDLSEKGKKNYLDDIFNHQYVSFDDESMPRLTYKYLLGNMAYNKSDATNTISYDPNNGKAKQQNSYSFILSAIAYKRLQDEFAEKGEDLDLTKPLAANVELMVTALPISESKSDDDINNYRNKFLNGVHTVTIWNFKEGHIQVNIKFKNVMVTHEGLIARAVLRNSQQFAPNLIKNADKQLARDYGKNKYDAEELFESENVLLIDVGSGTTDVVKIVDDHPLRDSKSIGDGYDSVLDRTVTALQDQGYNAFRNAHELDKYLHEEHKNKQQQMVEKDILNTVAKQTNTLTSEIKNQFRKMMKGTVQTKIDAIIVFGGGSVALNEITTIKNDLQEEAKTMGLYLPSEQRYLGIPVVWIGEDNPTEASNLNSLGLELMTKRLLSK